MKKYFRVEHLDTMAQGVDKENSSKDGAKSLITFISKVLPGEEGECIVAHKKSRVQFAYVPTPEYLSVVSKKRVAAECPHYNECPGCHYLHTDYESEVEFKLQAASNHFKKLDINKIEIVKADKRYSYRNRIQLHYDLKAEVIGFFNKNLKKITPITNCIVANEEIQNFLKAFLKDGHWKSQIKGKRLPRGHVEIYDKDNKINVSWNSRYSHLGFTQVNPEMNKLLVEYVQNKIAEHTNSNSEIIDLFGGNGNLTAKSKAKIDVVDSFKSSVLSPRYQSFITADLYKVSPEQLGLKNKCDLLVLDPPRSGMKNIRIWSDFFQPEHIIYVSCGADTLQRDLVSISNYKILEMTIFDLFPGTFHFESVAVLKKA